MDLPSKTIIDVLTFLLPGFITAAILHSLTPAPKPIPFERIIQALIFTIIIQVFVGGVNYIGHWAGRRVTPWGPWTETIAVGWSVTIAVLLGLFFVWASNSDKIHCVLRRLRITHQTSYASEWYGAFCRNQAYVVLHLTGSRRLLGWAEEWPSTPDAGHFVMSRAQWLGREDEPPTELPGVDRILIRAQDVEMVEMMKLVTERETYGGQELTGAASAVEVRLDREGRSVESAVAIPADTTTAATAEAIKRIT